MARIPKETVDQIIHHADIVEVVGDFVSLKKKGQNMWACCPFHNEKSPSFSVAPAKGLYKCFGCGKAGGVVQFVMDIEGTSYVEALKYLAKKYGIDIQEEEKTPEQQLAQNEKDSQFIVSNWAKDHYHRLLQHDEEGQSIGWSYLKQRGLHQATISTFELGYSLDQWDNLLKTATAAGYEQKYLEKTGLVVVREDDNGQDTGRRYDRFRGRVMFPIHNVSGRVIGFGARTLKPHDKTAKYLNSPESDIYHKSDVLYGLYQARQPIRSEELCYLVEGYLDVLSLHQGGIKNVVASSGTSLTDGQIRLIKRYTDNVTVLYDGDAAGIRASLRGIDMLLEGGLNVRVVLFPDGDDPDSYIRKVGDQRFRDHLETASQDFIQFKTDLVSREAAHDPVKKAEAIREVLQSISKVPDPIKRQVFLQQTSQAFGIDEQVLITEYNKLVRHATSKAPGGASNSSGSGATHPSQAHNRQPPITNQLGPEQQAEALLYGASPEEVGEFAGPAPAEELEPVPDVLEQCEREVVRLLLLYAAQSLAPDVSVAQYLLEQLDDTRFKTAIYADMLDLCREELGQGRWPEVRTFIQHGRADIRRMVAELATEKYELSPNWTTHQIYVPRELDVLQPACDNAILRLNKVNVERELAVRLEALRDAHADEAEMLENLQTIHLLKQMDNQLASMLGTVFPRLSL